MSAAPCNCYVARHPRAAEIDAALLAQGADPRDVAARFDVGKSRMYDHRKHLRDAGIIGPAPEAAPAATQEGAKEAPAPKSVPPARSLPVEPVKRPPAPPMERSMESVESRVESSGMSEAHVLPSPTITARALPSDSMPGGAYAQAVQTILGLKTNGAWRATHLEAVAQKFGLAKTSVKAAHAEAVRHLQLGMGDYLARQATSALWVTKKRDSAEEQSENAKKYAERWRRQEREAQERADRLEGKERFEALDQASRYGMLATKYDLSAEKWSAQALSHQRELNEVLCLRSPKAVNLTQVNGSANGDADLAAFGAALARRLAGRPDLLREVEAAIADIERSAEVIDATGG